MTLGLMALSLPSQAQPLGGKQEMVYEVYAGGIHAVQATLVMDLSEKGRYDLSLSAKTRGLLGKLAPWHGTFESNGWRLGNASFTPQLHRSTTTWREEEEVKSYNYAKDGSFKSLVIKDFNKKPRTETPDAALTDQTQDVFTATLETLSQVALGQGCGHSADIFDGKRRFAQHFVPKTEETLHQSRYNIYEGSSTVCTVEIEPKGGAWHKKPRGWMSIQEQGREKGMMPTVWMAQITPNMPAVPIKILVKTNYGALFMHLAQYNGGGEFLVAEKRVTTEED